MNKLGRKKIIAYGLVLTAVLIGLVFDRLGRMPDDTGSPAQSVSTGGNALNGPARAGAGLLRVAERPAVHGPAVAQIFETRFQGEPGGPQPGGPPARGQAGSPGDLPVGSVGTPVRNAFEMAPSMRAFYEGGGPNGTREQQKVQSEREQLRQEIASFQTAHKLRGTTLQEGLSWAIVDESVVRLGEKIDGFELKSVERYRALFVKGDAKAILSLPFP